MSSFNLSKNKRFGIMSAIVFSGIIIGILLISPVRGTIADPILAVQCPVVTHWDKIVFKVPHLVQSFGKVASPSPSGLIPDRTYDIKVIDDPTSVADLNQKVHDFLVAKGYAIIFPNGNGPNATPVDHLAPESIKIVSVEYAIECGANLTIPVQLPS